MVVAETLYRALQDLVFVTDTGIVQVRLLAPTHISNGVPVSKCIQMEEGEVLPIPISPMLTTLQPRLWHSVTMRAPVSIHWSVSSSVMAAS